MRIRMKTLSCGPGGVMEPGREYTVPSAVGQDLVNAGYAEPVSPAARRETAATGPDEVRFNLPGVAPDVIEVLAKMGITPGNVKDVDDETLLAIDGLGPKTLKKIRWPSGKGRGA